MIYILLGILCITEIILGIIIAIEIAKRGKIDSITNYNNVRDKVNYKEDGSMKKRYLFSNAKQMIDLAQEIQSRVYWGSCFYLDDKQINYKYFWQYCDEALEDEYDGVEIEGNEVSFFRTME